MWFLKQSRTVLNTHSLKKYYTICFLNSIILESTYSLYHTTANWCPYRIYVECRLHRAMEVFSLFDKVHLVFNSYVSNNPHIIRVFCELLITCFVLSQKKSFLHNWSYEVGMCSSLDTKSCIRRPLCSRDAAGLNPSGLAVMWWA